MKNLSFKTQQNAIVKRTLSLEEFIGNYIAPSHITDNDLTSISIADK